jgi:hypothetical protein
MFLSGKEEEKSSGHPGRKYRLPKKKKRIKTCRV